MQSLERSDQKNALPEAGITALFLFDYDCPESPGTKPVFESVQACLEASQGLCAFNDGGILSPKTVAALANHARVKKEVAGGVVDTERYRSITPSAAAMWTDRAENVDVFHDYLSAHSVRGYQGAFLLGQGAGYDDFLSFCSRWLNNGSRIGRRRYGESVGAWVEGLQGVIERWAVTSLGGIPKRLRRIFILAGASAMVALIFAASIFLASERDKDPRWNDDSSTAEVGPKEQVQLEVLPLSSLPSPAKPSSASEVKASTSADLPSSRRELELEKMTKQAGEDINTIRKTPPVAQTGAYTVQIGSFRNKKAATKIEASLRAAGYPVFVTSAQIPSKGLIHRVRVGTFKSRKEAQRFGKELREREPLIASFLVMANN